MTSIVDPVRIVPLYRPGDAPEHGASPPPAPKLVYSGGPLLTEVEVFTIFWGPWWQAGDGATLATELNGFFDFVLTSALIDQLGEYSTDRSTIGHGRRTGTTTVDSPPLGASVTDQAVQETRQGLIAAGTAPAADANTDPLPGQGWYDENHGEIGDICAWQTKRIGSYTVQLEWSNRAGTCI
jgi:hypothetical protein